MTRQQSRRIIIVYYLRSLKGTDMKLIWKFLAVACALFSLMYACAAAEGNVLSIPDGVKEICSEAFMNDASLETVIVPKGTLISDSAFAGCVNLKTLVFLGEELLTYDQAFSSLPIENVYCPEETEIQAFFLNLGVNVYPLSAYFADDQFEYEIVGSQAVITGYKGNDTDVQIPKAVRGLPVTKIGERAFEGNKTIVSVSIPDGIKKIGNYAFSNCTALYSIDISKTVRSIGDYAFINDRNLTIVTLFSGSVSFGENPFLNCSSLSGISVVSDGAQYSVIDGMLIDNNKLISYFTSKSAGSVTVPDGVTAVGKYAFSYAQYLDNVSVPDSCTIVDDYAFFECPSLKTVRLSENLQKIGASAFENCERLKEINLSNALLSVGDRAFKNCRSLSNCALPESVQSAGEDIFLLEETFSSSVMNIVPLYQFHYTNTICVIDNEEKSVKTSGCGATCVSMIIRYMNGDYEQTPETVFAWAYEKGYYKGDGLSHLALSRALSIKGIDSRWSSSTSDVLNCLKAGRPVIAHMGEGLFAENGHYILLRGIDENGNIFVNDPNSRELTSRTFSLNLIKSQLKVAAGFCIVEG